MAEKVEEGFTRGWSEGGHGGGCGIFTETLAAERGLQQGVEGRGGASRENAFTWAFTPADWTPGPPERLRNNSGMTGVAVSEIPGCPQNVHTI